MSDVADGLRLLRPIDRANDHLRGGEDADHVVGLVLYGDYLCPYCRRLRAVLLELREALGGRMVYVFRHFPNERAHPGATFASLAAEAAAEQGRFWDMHDALYEHDPPLPRDVIEDVARGIGLDMERFAADIARAELLARIEDDIADGEEAGVASTPTVYIDGLRYEGAWDFYSMLEAMRRPLGAQVERVARTFANLPTSSGIVLLLAALAALTLANTPLAPLYHRIVNTEVGIVAPSAALSLTVGAWASDGLLTFLFLVIGLEIRREMTTGALTDPRAAALPIIGTIGGVIAPALIYLAINPGRAAAGWSVPTATDIAFTLGILVLLGSRVPAALTVFVATLAVADDISSILTLAIFYPRALSFVWLIGSLLPAIGLYALSRWRVYAAWPYVALTIALWLALHAAGVDAALAGVILAAFIPTRPAPNTAALLAQAATAFADLEQAEDPDSAAGARRESILSWARLNLVAASERLLSPAERVEQAVQPWVSYVVLPLFALSATGVSLAVDLSNPTSVRVLAGVVLGLVIGKPLGIVAASMLAVRLKVAAMPAGAGFYAFLGAACLCGVGDTVSLLMADEAFPGGGALAQAAKVGVLAGSVLAGALGAAILFRAAPAPAPERTESLAAE